MTDQPWGELTYSYKPDTHSMVDLPVGMTGYVVQRRGGKVDPVTGEPIWEPGDMVNVWPVTIGPPPPPAKVSWWRRVLGWFRKPDPEEPDFRVSLRVG